VRETKILFIHVNYHLNYLSFELLFVKLKLWLGIQLVWLIIVNC